MKQNSGYGRDSWSSSLGPPAVRPDRRHIGGQFPNVATMLGDDEEDVRLGVPESHRRKVWSSDTLETSPSRDHAANRQTAGRSNAKWSRPMTTDRSPNLGTCRTTRWPSSATMRPRPSPRRVRRRGPPRRERRDRSASIHERRPVWRSAPGKWTKTSITLIRYEGVGSDLDSISATDSIFWA